MTRRLVLSYLVITLFVLAVLEIPLGITFASSEEVRLFTDIERDARVLATVYEDHLEHEGVVLGPEESLDYASRTGGRVVVVDRLGTSLLDTSPALELGRDFSSRPEIAQALNGGLATGSRPSETLQAELIYVAVPIGSGGRVYGAIRISYPRSTLDDRVRNNWIRLAVLSVVAVGAVLIVGWMIARSVTRPVRALQLASARVADGKLSTRVDPDGPPELRLLAGAFNDMTERVESMVHREKAFSADASHQLRTPLTALRLRLEAIEYSIDDTGRADLDAALRETERLSNIVDALLALARSAGGTAPLVDVDLAAIARERVETWRPLADERSIRLDYQGPVTVPAVAMNGAVDQILDNLLSNALEVAPDGSSIRVVGAATTAAASLSVIDEGPGMTDDEIARAFDRFFTTNGTGLGLAIARQLAQASRGSARLRRTIGGGLEVSITLRSTAERSPR
ncbi:MAG: HAMP domain-containing protein [Actinobacteria bacterium]|uniref:histidine kinase n=1 Tax=freshwater metagenome TaxID=449393 RepID=A0A6J7PIJ7_9ZZZZ|nr:HAMP domain-containing protein [Actinomycetota bacterium]MSW91990.1 HAMP domain-containing protein [Actinomycetota bacterium]MSX88177.1 HAMP domain-containing protein [Actinomycetota bacterium]MSY73370.1 HAMP domain-containing protein [Actinomycetota bacterium]